MSFEDFGILNTDEARLELIAYGLGIVILGATEGLKDDPDNELILPLAKDIAAVYLGHNFDVDQVVAGEMAEDLFLTAMEELK